MHNQNLPEPLFIGEPICVEHDRPPQRQKAPHCPDRFTWRDQRFHIAHLHQEWHDFRRRGKMARNMQPQHARRARRIGSWGVGRYYFRVETTCDRLFDIYYDRAPRSADDRLGHWYLFQEYPRDST